MNLQDKCYTHPIMQAIYNNYFEIKEHTIGCFWESYYNGFYAMQTWYETFAAWVGADVYTISHPTWHNIVQFATDTINVILGH